MLKKFNDEKTVDLYDIMIEKSVITNVTKRKILERFCLLSITEELSRP